MKESQAWGLIAEEFNGFAHGQIPQRGLVGSGLCSAVYWLLEQGLITKTVKDSMRWGRLQEHWPPGYMWWWVTDREGAACRAIMAQLFAEMTRP